MTVVISILTGHGRINQRTICLSSQWPTARPQVLPEAWGCHSSTWLGEQQQFPTCCSAPSLSAPWWPSSTVTTPLLTPFLSSLPLANDFCAAKSADDCAKDIPASFGISLLPWTGQTVVVADCWLVLWHNCFLSVCFFFRLFMFCCCWFCMVSLGHERSHLGPWDRVIVEVCGCLENVCVCVCVWLKSCEMVKVCEP